MSHDHSLPQRLHDSLIQLGVRETHVLIAVSGGPDSVALWQGLLQLRDALGLTLTVAHFNHRFRGAAADADAAWVADLARAPGVPVVIGAPTDNPGSLHEESARRVRYEFLEQTARAIGATSIATGHTRDDQVETVLHHLLRGTGPAGLRGIPRERLGSGYRIVRPLLEISRAQVLDFLQAGGQPFRVDDSNADTGLTRNWLRHELLPVVRTRFPHVDEAVSRMAVQMSETVEVIEEFGCRLLADATLSGGESVELSVAILKTQPRASIRAALVQLWNDRGWPRQEMGYDRWNELADLVSAESGAVTLPGRIEARISRSRLTLRRL